MIQIFNRSHYEDILITRVHGWCDDETAKKRMKAINDFENLLEEHNNTHILKFYLHISKEEQQERLMERMKDPGKMWKYNEKDFEEAKLSDDYRKMYEDCFENCNKIPWTIVPADQNWYKEFIIASALYELLKGLDMKFPGLKNSVIPFNRFCILYKYIFFTKTFIMGMLKEFKEFAMKGNLVDIAVAFVMGACIW